MSENPQESALVLASQVQPQSLSVSSAMRLDDILAQVKLIQDVMHKVMTAGEHYGTIPGCGDKKTLLQPGAQKLTMTFRLAPAYEIQEVNLERGHKEYRVTCTLKSIQSGNFVGQGVGCCSTMESKYRYRGGARVCPECGKTGTVIKGKEQYGGGWLCWPKKDGCGAKWPDGAKEIEDQQVDKVENENPADCYNTVLKIAKKRAFVDATITATAASDIFTQDIGDEENLDSRSEYLPKEAENAPQRAATSKPDATQANKTTSEGVYDAQKAISAENQKKLDDWAKYRMKVLNKLDAAPGQRNRVLLTDFLTAGGVLEVSQVLEDWPIKALPTDDKGIADIKAKMEAWHQETAQRELEAQQ